jgi:Ca2+-binding EF-hand superfamily protein
MFRIFDTDNNGFISVDEMNKIVEHLFHLVPEWQKDTVETPESVSEALNRNKTQSQIKGCCKKRGVSNFMNLAYISSKKMVDRNFRC